MNPSATEKFLESEINSMSNDAYDSFMCRTFPEIFADRTLSAMESTMHWGFNIPQHWQYILYNATEDLQEIYVNTGILTKFAQVKTKFGTPRFYYDIVIPTDTKLTEDEIKVIDNKIDHIVSQAENACPPIPRY